MELALEELRIFEQRVPMTLLERKEVRKWVHQGNSVLSNPWWYYYDNCSEMNYLDALRFDEALAEEM